MQRLPAVTIVTPRATAWRVAVALFVGAAAFAAGPRLIVLAAERPLAALLLALAALAVLGFAASAARMPRLELRHGADGWRWRPAGAPQDPLPAEVGVAIDLGGWILVQVRLAGATRRRTAWLPLAAGEHGAAGWHALRCALAAGARRHG